MTENKAHGYNIGYPQVGFRCFVDRKLVFEKQLFVGSSSVKSRPAYSLFRYGAFKKHIHKVLGFMDCYRKF
jgi:hypothetical protein